MWAEYGGAQEIASQQLDFVPATHYFYSKETGPLLVQKRINIDPHRQPTAQDLANITKRATEKGYTPLDLRAGNAIYDIDGKLWVVDIDMWTFPKDVLRQGTVLRRERHAAAHADEAEVKFDPAQPRDEGGRWTTTGAGDYGQGTAPSEAGIAGAEKAEVMFNEGLAKDWRGASAQQAADIKDDIVKKISDDSDMSYDDTNNFIHQWAESSNDDDLRSLAIQRDTAAEFRVELSGFTNDRISEMNVEREEFEVKMRKRARRQFRSELESGAMTESQFQAIASEWIADTLSDVHPRLLPLTEPKAQRQILRAMYDNTQARLRDAGLKAGDTIRLYRGTRLPDKVAADWKLGDVVSVVGNALESWSLSKEVADKFARGSFAQPDVRGIIFEMDIPVEAIIGSARTGFGCLTEGEFVVLGIPGDAQVELNF